MPAANVQLAVPKVPLELVARLTVPVGNMGLDDVSVTVTVHVVELPTVSEFGEQLMLVIRVRVVTVGLTLFVLPKWLESPPYVPVIA